MGNKTLSLLAIFILYIVGGALVYTVSPDIIESRGYGESNFIFKRYLLYTLLAISILIISTRLKAKEYFDAFGSIIAICTVLIVVLVLIDPVSTPVEPFVFFGSLTFYPSYFFTLASLWFISFVYDRYDDVKFTNITIVTFMIITALYRVEFNVTAIAVTLEIVYVGLLFYINGINKITLAGLIASLIALISFVLISPYRVERISSWLDSTLVFNSSIPFDGSLYQNILHTVQNYFSTLSLIVVIVVYAALLYTLLKQKYTSKKYQIFTVGVVMALAINLVLNILYLLGLSPLYPTSIYLFTASGSAILVSSVMLAMVFMARNKDS